MARFDHWTSVHPVIALAAVTALTLTIATALTGLLQALGVS
jgi:hypothetical protein